MTEPVGSSRGTRPTPPRTGSLMWLSDGLVGVALVVMTVSGAVYLIGSIVG
jgi:hypothetical protein